jgi:L-malate glycosyltransferase
VTRVHQALSSVGPYDAISGQAVLWRALLEKQGRAGGIHAEAIDPRAGDSVRPLSALEPEPDDLIVIRYSAFASRLRGLLDLPHRKLLVYHNVTPARYLWNHHPAVAVACELGRRQLPRYAQAVDAAVADSEFNAAELRALGGREVGVVPILFDPGRLESRGRAPSGRGPLVAVVGRLVPNKRPDLALAAFAAYQRACAPDARLLMIGEPLSPAFGRTVERLVDESGASNVTIAGGISQADLNAAYAEADVLLSTSEHEGFCVPLLEAFSFGVPVVARPAGAMPEVGADAVLWSEDADAAVIAELIDLAVRDAELRDELRRRGLRQLELFAPERTELSITSAIDAALGA